MTFNYLIRHLLITVLFAITGTVSLNAKGSADSASRLIAQVNTNGTAYGLWGRRDSTVFYYRSPNTTDYQQALSFSATPSHPNWSIASKADYSYNSTGALSKIAYSEWNVTSFVNYTNDSIVCDAAGRVTDMYELDSFGNASSYTFNTHEQFSYNSASSVIAHTWEKWNTVSNAWFPIYRLTYTRNSVDKVLSEVAEGWDTSSKIWYVGSKNDTVYDNTGMFVQEAGQYVWNTTSLSWQGSRRNVFTNDGLGRHISSIYQEWDTASHGWLQRGRHTFTYTGADLAGDLYETYNTSTSSFDSTYRTDILYNSYDQCTRFLQLGWKSGAWLPTNTSLLQMNYYETYSTLNVHETAGPQFQFTIAPVPANQSLSFNLVTGKAERFSYTITDMQGRVYQRSASLPLALHTTTSVATGSLPAGNYIISIQGDSGSSVSQLFSVVH